MYLIRSRDDLGIKENWRSGVDVDSDSGRSCNSSIISPLHLRA